MIIMTIKVNQSLLILFVTMIIITIIFIMMMFWRVTTIILKHQIPAITRWKQDKGGQSRLIDKFAIGIEKVRKKFGNEKLIMSDMPMQIFWWWNISRYNTTMFWKFNERKWMETKQ